ncbi:MAG: hypothetical protein HC849_29055 [Oscillatoriales cyanobacterium RU_3_3]|nr:hypothetical protein [Microcoleus sp. SU_5_6]NJL69531.1 hypothetical protein [Microcoleus sp. SM1_3_4]NJM63308.1 hypothetical protein [Oscillatoriales cyanobacterium RU_3_3]NJR25671.1 hypothetical protein [Richelia sp. CSU_2_1]
MFIAFKLEEDEGVEPLQLPVPWFSRPVANRLAASSTIAQHQQFLQKTGNPPGRYCPSYPRVISTVSRFSTSGG